MAFFGNRRSSDSDTQDREDNTPRILAPQQPIGFETVLGASNVMEGKLVSKGNVRLDGEFSGDLEIMGNVLVGETARITADVEARNISIAGHVRGNVTGNKVQILRTGRVWGDIHAKSLTMEEGAFIDGKINMSEHTANLPAEPVPVAIPAPDDTVATTADTDETVATAEHEATDDDAIDAEVTVDDDATETDD